MTTVRTAARPARAATLAAALVVAAIGLALAHLTLGTPAVAPARLAATLTEASVLERAVVWQLRLPRLTAALVAGAAIGAVGLLLQEGLRNRLAVPELLGVSSGASLAVAVCVVWALPVAPALHPIAGAIGAMAGAALCLAAASRARSATGVLLAGAAVSTALGALLLSVVAAGDRIQYDMLYRYMYGSLTGTTWDQVRLLALWLLLAVPTAVAAVPTANLLRLGDQAVASLGRHPGRARLLVMACAALLCGATVGAVGPVAWVGFLAPLLARRFLPAADARAWLPLAAGCGAILTAAADLAARLAFAPVETPLGAWTAALCILGGVILLSGQQREAV